MAASSILSGSEVRFCEVVRLKGYEVVVPTTS